MLFEGGCEVELTSAAVGSSLPPNHPVDDFASSSSTVMQGEKKGTYEYLVTTAR
jgi:hypothetical protein